MSDGLPGTDSVDIPVARESRLAGYSLWHRETGLELSSSGTKTSLLAYRSAPVLPPFYSPLIRRSCPILYNQVLYLSYLGEAFS